MVVNERLTGSRCIAASALSLVHNQEYRNDYAFIAYRSGNTLARSQQPAVERCSLFPHLISVFREYNLDTVA